MLFPKRKLWPLSRNYCKQRTVSFIGIVTLERLFKESKREIVDKIEKGVKTFEINRTTGLGTDFSNFGISFFFVSETLHLPRRSRRELRWWSLEAHSGRIPIYQWCGISWGRSLGPRPRTGVLPNVYNGVTWLASDSRPPTINKNILWSGPGKH